MVKDSFKTGIGFGLTSGVITTLGLMVGLHSGTHSKTAVIGGILTIAVADAFSDAMGIHISEESKNLFTTREIWESTAATFLAKFIIAATFVIPVLLFSLTRAIALGAAWGLFLLSVHSFHLARDRKESVGHVLFEHLSIAAAVIVLTHLLGDWIGATFK